MSMFGRTLNCIFRRFRNGTRKPGDSMPLPVNEPLKRLLKWTCPECGAVELEEIPMPQCAKQEPSIVETIELHCEACERKRLGFGATVAYKPSSVPVNRVFGKSVAPDGP